MTPQEAFEGYLREQIGAYAVMIAHQSGAAAGLQNKIAELEKKCAELKEHLESQKKETKA